jgi:hypothetical protein
MFFQKMGPVADQGCLYALVDLGMEVTAFHGKTSVHGCGRKGWLPLLGLPEGTLNKGQQG